MDVQASLQSDVEVGRVLHLRRALQYVREGESQRQGNENDGEELPGPGELLHVGDETRVA
jgi:hypothetical protein